MKAGRYLVGLLSLCSAERSLANITGSDLQNFNATTNGLDFVTVQSSETLGPGIFNLGLFANYAVNTLPRYEDADGRSSSIDDSVVAADFNVGVGLTSFLDIGISFPHVVYQTVDFEGSRGQFGDKGLTEVRGNAKLRLLGDRSGGVAFISSVNVNVTKNNPYVGEDPNPIFNFELAADTTIGPVAIGANVGYRLRDPGKPIEGFPIEPLKDQYLGSLAASYLFTSIDTKLIFEVFSAFPVEETKTVTARQASATEALLGLKYDATSELALHAGAGTELDNGTSSADWRIYTGVNYTFGFKQEEEIVRPVQQKRRKRIRPLPPPPKFIEAAPDPGPQEPAGEGDEVFVLRGVNFAFDSASRVLPGTRDILTDFAEHMKKVGYDRILIEGHTDSVGSEPYNLNLGQQRAATIRDYLVQKLGFDGTKIEVRSYGETVPVADNGNYQGRQINRRVVFRITYPH